MTMSDDQKRPQVGNVVWRRGVIVKDDRSDIPFRVQWDDGDFDWHYEDAVVKMINCPPAQERKPWETLREAAELMRGFAAAYTLRTEADRLERAAAPPDPVDLLREYDAIQTSVWPSGPDELQDCHPGKDLWRKVRASLAAHDAKKDRANG